MKKVLFALIIYLTFPGFTVLAASGEPVLRAGGDSSILDAEKCVWGLINDYVDPSYYLSDDYSEGSMSKEQESELSSEAKRVVEGCSDSYEKIRAVYTYVAGRTYYDRDSDDYYPYEVYKSCRAVCQGYAALANYMLQSVGVPSMMVHSDYHLYNASYCEEQGRWVVFDSTWGCGNTCDGVNYIKGSVDDTYFDISVEDLAKYDNHEVYFVDGIVDGSGKNSGYYTLNTGFAYDKNDRGGIGWGDTDSWFLELSGSVNGRKVDAVGSIGGIEVNKIHEFAFDDSKIESIDLSRSYIKSIDSGAFRDCKKLKSVSLGNSIVNIGECAFSGCTSLKSIDMSGLKISKLDREVFYNCKSLSSVKLPSSLKSVGGYAFSRSAVKSLNMVRTKIAKIGAYAFENCNRLKSVSFPKSLSSVGGSAFSGCSKLRSLNFSRTEVKVIPKYCFEGCSSLKSFKGSMDLVSIRSKSFEDCFSLKKVKLYRRANIARNAFVKSASVKYITG